MKRPTDWNDLHAAHGLSEVRRQFADAVKQKNAAQEPSGPPTERPKALARGIEAIRCDVHALSNHYWLMYGTDEVWDDLHKRILKLSDFRSFVANKDNFKTWENTRQIRMSMVFEPRYSTGDDVVNLYDGFELQRLEGSESVCEQKCQRILEHIWFLVGGEETEAGSPEAARRTNEYFWLLRWIALPLQKPGTKMASAVIMHGAEGTGKSYLWEKIVKKIYGKYGITIGQSQLESDFNGWASAKLFSVAEEVVSRAERAHHKGKLKHLITGSTLLINEKLLRLREEPNLMNSAFLSNGTQPMELDYGDRRYYVRRIDHVKPESYFKALVQEVENGGLEAFYGYLMEMSLEGFDHNTKPPLNDDKQALIGLGLSPAAYFHEEWKAGQLDYPYGATSLSDLWDVFNRWRTQTNHQHPVNSRIFNAELSRYMMRDRKDIKYPTLNEKAVTQRVWVPRELFAKRDEAGYIETLSKQACEFRAAVEKHNHRAYQHEAAA